MNYTILGGEGFVGSNFKSYLLSQGINCTSIPRDFDFATRGNYGHVIYAIGLTADFRQRPMDTVKAHVSKLVDVLEKMEFDSFLYLSSTRVYGDNGDTTEDAYLRVNPNNFSDLYNLSKLMGESVCLSLNRPTVRIARLSNVLGNDFKSENFVLALIKEAVREGTITLQSSLFSEKDYITINDVTRLMKSIVENGKERLYNLASGFNITNGEIIDVLRENIPFKLNTIENSQLVKFSPMSIKKIRSEFSYVPEDIIKRIDTTIKDYKLTLQ